MRTVGSINPSALQAFLYGLVEAGQPQTRCPRLDDAVDEARLLGLEPGMPVMVAMPNGRQLVTVVFALMVQGAVPVLLAPSAPPSRVQRMAEVLGAEALIAPRIPPDLRNHEMPRTIGQDAQLAFLRRVDARRYSPGEIILLTSGTSGIFSGCLHRIDSLLLNAARHVRAIGQTSADRVLINLPMYYSYAFVAQLLGTLVAGGRAVIAGPPFTPVNYERTIRDYEITLSSLTPKMVESWRSAGRKLPKALRRLTVGGAALDASSVADVLERNPGLELYLTYGLTEAGPRVSTLAAHLEPPRRYASVGLPLPGVHVQLRKENAGDEVGELIVETDTGLLRRVGRRDALAGPVDDTRTLISTGDRFELDDEGYLFFRGRRQTFVVSRGEKVCLKSVCEIAETIPGVLGAEAWTHENVAGDLVFTLDIYCADGSPDEQEIRRRLAKVLLRSEYPAGLVTHPASHLGWQKSDAR